MALSTRVEASVAPVPARVVSPIHVAVHHGRAPQMSLVLAHASASGLASLKATDSLAVLPNETIMDIKMRLRNQGWFSSKSCLVIGDRELADAVRVSDLVKASGKTHASYLHVFVKLADVESVNIRTLMRELSLANPAAAEQQLADRFLSRPSSGDLLALPAISEPEVAEGTPVDSSSSSFASSATGSSSVDQDASNPAPADASSSHCRAVVHLMVHKSAKVNWHHMQENKFELNISSSETVDSLLRKIEAANGLALEGEHTVLIDGQPIDRQSGMPLASYISNERATKLELVPCEPDVDALPEGSPSLHSPGHLLHQHWQAARAGLAEGLQPTLAKAGTGGSYFLQDVQGKPVAVFKPEDEEPHAVNNPKGRTGSSSDGSSGSGSEGLKRGTRPGEGAVREVAAYVLDHGHFAGVPPTALVSAFVDASDGGAVKVGSLQQFVEAEGDCEERGYSSFPVQEVHKIAVLDLRLGNADRNGGNILARRNSGSGQWELIPIDHGYCLPSTFEDLSFEWMYWPQAERPFDDATLAYIDSLDADRDEAILAAHGISLRPECLRVFRVCTMVLKKGAKAGLTPSQIAGVLCREGLTKSVVEKLHSNAMHLAKMQQGASASASASSLKERGVDTPVYMRHMEQLLDEYLEEFLLEGSELMY